MDVSRLTLTVKYLWLHTYHRNQPSYCWPSVQVPLWINAVREDKLSSIVFLKLNVVFDQKYHVSICLISIDGTTDYLLWSLRAVFSMQMFSAVVNDRTEITRTLGFCQISSEKENYNPLAFCSWNSHSRLLGLCRHFPNLTGRNPF